MKRVCSWISGATSIAVILRDECVIALRFTFEQVAQLCGNAQSRPCRVKISRTRLTDVMESRHMTQYVICKQTWDLQQLKRTLPTKKQTQLVLVQRQAGNRLLRFNLLRSKCWFGNVMAFRLGPSQRRFYSTWAAIRHRMSPDSDGSLAPFLFVSTSPL